MPKKASITVHPLFTIGDISPRLYGAFLEPIGTMVNGTMYNPKHPTADKQGFRRDFIDGLKAAQVPAVRMPGGNFVSGWDWKDSIGPKEHRKTNLDLAWHQYITNEVGHDEYLQWAELVGTEALYTINLGTGDIRDAISLVEYTNHEKGTYWSDLRRRYGHEKPYGIKTWYLGNEMDGPWQIASWEKDPRGYGIRANEVSKAIKWVDPYIETVACVSSAPFMDHYPQWDEDALTECYESVDYISLHHYHGAPAEDYAALLGGSCYYEDFINAEIALCDLIQTKLRSPKKMMISFDEYGTFPRPCEALHPGRGPHNMVASHYVFDKTRRFVRHDPDNMPQRRMPGGEMLGALTSASTVLTFLRHADRVKIGCMTGGLFALCASDHDHVWKSAAHYVFRHFMQYGRGVSLRAHVEGETFDIPGYAINDTSQYATKEGVPFIDTAAAYDPDNGFLHIFVINRDWNSDCDLSLDVGNFAGYRFLEHIQLYSEDMNASNSYENPNVIIPQVSGEAVFTGGTLSSTVKPLSWNVFRFQKGEKGI